MNLNPHTLFRLSIVTTLLLLPFASTVLAAGTEQPNILLILADDKY